MKIDSCLKIVVAALILATVFVGIGSADTSVQPAYSIQELKITPGTLMPGETGTLEITIANTGPIPLVIDKVSVTDSADVISVEHPAISSLGAIGAGKTSKIYLPIKAKDKEGTFYPTLYIDFKAATYDYSVYDSSVTSNQWYLSSAWYDYLKYPFPVTVDKNSVSVSVVQRPEVFEPGTTQKLGVSIGNLRANPVDAITVSASGNGVVCDEESVFLGSLEAGGNKTAFVTIITSDKTKEINLDVKYKNGASWHTESIKIPVKGGEIRTGAELLINNIEFKEEATYTKITGDVNNAGLKTAKGVTVTLEGAEKTQPYPVYAVGGLDADGLSEFELSFINPESDEITLIFTYKDENGNTYTQKEKVPLWSSAKTSSSSGVTSGGNPILATIAAILLILIVGGAVFLIWKKGNLLPRKQQK